MVKRCTTFFSALAVLAGVLTFLTLSSGCNDRAASATSAAQSTGDSIVFLSVVSDEESNPQSLDMAMKFAGFSLDEGRHVVMFFNVKGVTVPTHDFDAGFAFGAHEPITTQLRSLIERGVDVHVCPVCMSALGVDAEDLIDGARVTTRSGLFATLGDRTVVMTY